MGKKGDPQARTADGDKVTEPRTGDALTADELVGKAPPTQPLVAPGKRAPVKLCGGCRRELKVTDNYCPVCVPNGASATTFGGSNPANPEEPRTMAMGLPPGRFPHGGF